VVRPYPSFDRRLGAWRNAARMKRAALLFLVAVVVCRCTAARAEEEREREERRSRPNRSLARALDDVAHGVVTDGFRVRVEWSRSGRMVSAEIYGSGAGIWNDERAFRVTSVEIADIARALREARFAAMPERFGEAESDFLTMRGKVNVAVGDAAKTVVQIDRGPQSDELANLAAAILARAEAASRNGIAATSLTDGLEKIASGAIPAEALRVTAQQRGAAGFLLQIRGGEATARRFEPKSGYGPPRRMRVAAAEIVEIVKDGAAIQNAHAPEYTELRVEILGRAEERMARPESPNTRDARFDAAIDALRGIAERALAQGKPAPAVE
jgi:hypothetical protein